MAADREAAWEALRRIRAPAAGLRAAGLGLTLLHGTVAIGHGVLLGRLFAGIGTRGPGLAGPWGPVPGDVVERVLWAAGLATSVGLIALGVLAMVAGHQLLRARLRGLGLVAGLGLVTGLTLGLPTVLLTGAWCHPVLLLLAVLAHLGGIGIGAWVVGVGAQETVRDGFVAATRLSPSHRRALARLPESS